MKGTSCRAFVVALASWCAAGRLGAADPVPVESVAPAALGAAREELSTVKGAKQAEDARPGMRAVEMPKLHPTPEADAVPRRRPAPGRDERGEVRPKGDNWLLEGVAREKALAEKSGRSPRESRDRNQSTRTRGGADSPNGEGDGPWTDSEGDGPRTDEHGPSAAEESAAPEALTEPVALPEAAVANPLADFLGDWLSPNDHDLLRSTLVPSGGAGVSREGYGARAMESANPVIAGMGARGRFDADQAAAKTAENPFLAFLQPPEASADAPAIAPPPAPAPAPLPPPARLESPPQRSRTPDFVRPLQDEKYYKPLKRF